MTAEYQKYNLKFKNPVGTSRGILEVKETYLLRVFDRRGVGLGECAVFRGLSFDDVPEYEQKLQWLCKNINQEANYLKKELLMFPSILFGWEQAMVNLGQKAGVYYPSAFTEGKEGISINGLIWMGDEQFILRQIEEKLEQGFRCIKLKIGVDWGLEKRILKNLREQFPKETLELRVDANGAFDYRSVPKILDDLAMLEIHSIEQPIKAKKYVQMSSLCRDSPIPIALDEDLIGVLDSEQKANILDKVMPQYIILKPSLLGGFESCDEWIALAEERGIGWWITSALESNVGLNAIAQYTFTKKRSLPQGLGTGGLFTNNFPSSLQVVKDKIWMK